MKRVSFIIFICNVIASSVAAQHCAPITKTALNEVSVIRIDSSLKIQFEFVKNGGQIKDAYQVYLLAYLKKDKNDVFEEEQKASFRKKQLVNIYNQNTTIILKKDIIKQAVRYDKAAEGTIYGFSGTIKIIEIAKKVVKHGNFMKENNYWGEFKIAVFIPFLDDKEHSVDQRLPKDTHECNYQGRSFLILQELNHTFKIYSEDTNNSDKKFYIVPLKE
jgi:hypothetical protein